jgi:integrase
VRWLRREEAARLVAELPLHLADLAALTLATGLRQSNASFLTWAQIDLGRGMAWIHAEESKSGKAFAMPLNEDAMRILQRRRGEHPDYVITYNGYPVARTSTRAWKKAKERAGIEDFRWHDLRHTWASWHAQNGTSLHELQALGGWSCIEMVQRYAHLGGEHLKAAANRIDGTNLAQSAKYGNLKLVVSN